MAIARLGFLVSHRGSNMQAIIDACNKGRLEALPAVVISNNSACEALNRALREGIPHFVVNADVCANSARSADDYMLELLLRHHVDWVILAGYMKKLGAVIVNHFAGRILNIHPSLLPKFGGQGMYGLRVHEAVLAAGEGETGATVHLVDADYDQGPILAQQRVRIEPDDTAETLASRLLQIEHELFVETLSKVIRGEITG